MFDTRLKKLETVLAARPAHAVPRLAVHVEAAVAVLVRPADDLEVLLIRRTRREGDPWSGHIAFPGGRRSSFDAELVDTAFRETEEETGIAAREHGQLLGRLDEVEPATRRLPPIVITPFVIAVPPGTEAVPNPAEVVDAEWVALSALRQEGAASELRVRQGDFDRIFPSLVYREYVIWGLTHRILGQFLQLAAKIDP